MPRQARPGSPLSEDFDVGGDAGMPGAGRPDGMQERRESEPPEGKG